MKMLIVKILVASGLLNLVSLVERESMDAPLSKCPDNTSCTSVSESTQGFPFSYFGEISTTGASESLHYTSLDYASLLSNWLFWAAVAVVGFFILRWVWDKFSRMIFYAVIAGGIVVYILSVNTW